jgi:hypothetical protein
MISYLIANIEATSDLGQPQIEVIPENEEIIES